MKIIELLDDLRCNVEIEGFKAGEPNVVRNRKMDSADLLTQFGLKPNSPIPPEYTARKQIGNTWVVILQKTQKGPSKRVIAQCRICGRMVGAGAYSQHLRVCEKHGA